MKVFLVGSTGMLGQAMQKEFKRLKVDFAAPKRIDLDITHHQATKNHFQNNTYTHICLAHGYTKVDEAENEKEKCFAVNTDSLLPFIESKIPIIHFSTDYVFDGESEEKFRENFPTNPVNTYGESKAEAEKLLEKSPTPWWNIRTSWLYGNENDFLSKIWNRAKNELEIPIINDQWGRPTWVEDLAKTTVSYFILNTPKTGHYHLTNSGDPITWADFAKTMLIYRKWQGNVHHISSKDIETVARRPKYAVLENTKAPQLPYWKDALYQYLKTLP